eukprot:scaffold26317_cov313-Cylindrotheca_fusiformis.AAC.1
MDSDGWMQTRQMLSLGNSLFIATFVTMRLQGSKKVTAASAGFGVLQQQEEAPLEEDRVEDATVLLFKQRSAVEEKTQEQEVQADEGRRGQRNQKQDCW